MMECSAQLLVNNARLSGDTLYQDLKSQEDHVSEQFERMKVLRTYDILDTEPEQSYDDIAALASMISGCPHAGICFLDTDKQRAWMKAKVGIRVNEVPFWDHELTEREQCPKSCPNNLVELEDLRMSKWSNSHLVENGFIYFAAVPLCAPGGFKLGNLFVLDKKPRQLTDSQKNGLVMLSRQTTCLLELRLKVNELSNANKDKNNFLGMISHDIRQPLGNIMLSCELISQDFKHSPNHQELIQTIHSSAGLMHHMVDELLQMLKLDFGRLQVELDKRSVDMARLVSRVVNMNSLYAKKKDIKLQFGISNWGGQGSVISYSDWEKQRIRCAYSNVDVVKMEQVLNNLLSNAVKFSYPGSTVEVFLEKHQSDTEKTVEISVVDHGQGIPADEIKNLFKAFSRVSVKPTAGESSTGLGLCSVKNIVEAHGGSIKVSSTVGAGSKFTIVLPLAPCPLSLRDSLDKLFGQSTDGKSEKRVLQSKERLHILIAEDNSINQRLMSQVLSKHGHTVDVASDGFEALEMYEEKKGSNGAYDVLLVDEEMPRMNGSEMAQKIREAESLLHLRTIPIISISGYASEEHKENMKQIGVNYCLPKPFQIQQLVMTVERFGTSK